MGRYRVSSDRLIGYEPIPGLRFDGPDLKTYDYRTSETNSLGYRDREHALSKPSGVTRIVVLGDSLAMGLWVPKIEDIFPAKLEARLNQRGLRTEVLNFGVVGYNTLQEVATLADRGLRFEPDMVLVQYCLNDRERSDGDLLQGLMNAEKKQKAISSARLSRSLVWSAFYRFMRYRALSGFQEDYRKVAEDKAARLREDTVDEAFESLGDLSRIHGFQVLLTLFPNFSNLADYRFLAEHTKMRRVAETQGFAFLDLLQPMRECARDGKGRPVSFDVYHPTEYGHTCAARAMSAAILDVR